MRCYVSKKTLAQACCLSVILIFILTFVPFSLTNAKEKAAFNKQTKGKLLVQSTGTKLLARPPVRVEEVKSRPPTEIKSHEQVKVMPPVENKVPQQVDVKPPVESKVAQQVDVKDHVENKVPQHEDVKPPVENKVPQQVDVRPPVENKVPQQVDVRPSVENKVPQKPDVRPAVENKVPQQPDIRSPAENKISQQPGIRSPVENKVPQQVDMKPPVENKIPQPPDVRPAVENKVPQQVDVKPAVDKKFLQQADVRLPVESKMPPVENKKSPPLDVGSVKERPVFLAQSPDTQQKSADKEKSTDVASLRKPYLEQEKSSIAKTGAELNEKLDTEKKNMPAPEKVPDEKGRQDTIENIANKGDFNKDSGKPVAGTDRKEKVLVPVENNNKTTESSEKNVQVQSSNAEKSNPFPVTIANKTDIKKKLIDLNVKDNHPVSVIKVQNKVLPVTIPGSKDLQHMEKDQLEELYYLYIENLQTHCVRQRHIGNEEYGGYHICEDVMNDLPCLVYSFGSEARKEVSFDYDVAKQYGCDVHLFNPGNKEHGTQATSSKMIFHTIGLNGEDDPEHNTLTLSSIKAKLNHKERKIDVLKLDLESGEWEALEQMCRGHDLDSVKLLIVEFHVCLKNCLDKDQRTKEHYVRYLSLLKQLYDLGFRIYFFRMWPSCTFKVNGNTHTACHDVHMMKKS